MKHPFLGDDIEDMLRKLNEEAARNPPVFQQPLPAGWCRCGDSVCHCGVNAGGGTPFGGRNTWSMSPQARVAAQRGDGGGFIGLEGDWCRGGLPGGIRGLRAALAPPEAAAAPVTVQTVSVPATGQPAAPRATPWTGYLSYVLRRRGYLA